MQAICRLCTVTIKYDKRNPYTKERFHTDIFKLFGIDVQTENENEYPTYICRRDGRELYKLRSGEQTVDKSFLKDLKPPVLFTHENNDTCLACKFNPKGRPHKRRLLDDTPHKGKKIKVEEKHPASFYHPNENFNEACSNSVTIDALLKHFENLSNDGKTEFLHEMLNKMNEDDLHLMSFIIGKRISNEIYKDGQAFQLLYKDLKSMADFQCIDWLEQRNKTVLSFLLGTGNLCSELSFLRDSKQTILTITRAVEQIYMVNNPVIISPLSFLMNISAYSLSGSKTLVDILGNANPAAHYKTVTEWLRDQNADEIKIELGDVLNVFDNEQVIGRKHAIKPGNKAAISIITNKAYCCMDPNGNLQENPELKPVQLLKVNDVSSSKSTCSSNEEQDSEKLKLVVDNILTESSPQFAKFEKDHSEQLALFIKSAIETVMLEQKDEDGEIIDDFDVTAAKESLEDHMIQCPCGEWNADRKIVCTKCKRRDGLKKAKESKKESTADYTPKQKTMLKKLVFEKDSDNNTVVREEELRYAQVSSNHKGKQEIIVTDPVFCNPNSLETVARVLRMIGTENGIVRYGGSLRHWTFICCDGLPYLICKKLKDEAVVCTNNNCNKQFLSQKEFLNHVKADHPGTEHCTFIHEFDWFYLRIGAGHYEMNLMKSFFELNWTPFLESLCEKMGFVSEAAKQYAKACKDTHKTWNLLLVFHLASLRELVLPYVRDCIKKGTHPDVKGFFKFSQTFYRSINFPNYRYYFLQVTRFSQAIINFRMAVRRNNSDLIKSAKYMTKELFNGRSHPKYQSIEVYDTLQDLMMPEAVMHLNDAYTSITTTGNHSTGEDFDFILEEKNRQVKSWIPKGVPTDSIWLSVCRNNDMLEKLKRSSLSLLGIHATEGKIKELDLEEAITGYRCVLRKSNYLGKKGDHTSLSGMALDDGLVDFLEESSKRRLYFTRTEILGEEIDIPLMRHPVAITPEEKIKLSSIQSMTVDELKKEIILLLQLITDPLQQDFHNYLYKSEVKSKNKAKHIQFLEQLRETLSTFDNQENSNEESSQN